MDINEVLNLDFNSLLEELKKATGISANGLAKAIGISPTQISQIRNGTYKDVEGTEEKARAYIKQELEKLVSEEKDDIKIKFSFIDKVSGNINLGLKLKKIVLFRGDSGSGKTTLLKSFRKEYPNSIFIQAYKGMKKTELIAQISGGKESSLKKIKERVKGKILIIDEVNKLSGGTLEWLRSLHDIADNMPMLWAGTYEDIDEVLYKQRELNRRCRKAYMPELNKDDLKLLMKSFDFKNSDVYEKILIERFKGNLALCLETLKEMKRLVEKNGESKDTFLTAIEAIE